MWYMDNLNAGSQSGEVGPDGGETQVTVESVTYERDGQVGSATIYRIPSDTPSPAVVLLTGFAGTQDTPSLVAAARAFAAEGWVAATFDYLGFGSSGGKPRQVVDLEGQQADIAAVIATVGAHPAVDGTRIALWGTSLGGAQAVVAASARPGLAAVVAQVPFNGFPADSGRSRGATARLLAAIMRDRLRQRLGRPPRYIKVVGPPDALAVMASDEAVAATEHLGATSWVNLVAPGALLDMMRLKPASAARRLAMPLLVCAATGDRETPADDAAELAAAAPRGRLIEYPVTHFEVYDQAVQGSLLTDQVAFLREAFGSGR